MLEDDLTGVYNATYLKKYLGDLIAGKESFALALFDLGRLGKLQERTSALERDRVLKKFAGRLKATLRGNDVVARTGDDAFAVVLRRATANGAVAVADRVQRNMLKKPIKLSGGASVGLELAAGIAAFPDDSPSPEGLLDAAETALFAAKKAERDRIVTASGADPAVKAERAAMGNFPCRLYVGRGEELAVVEQFLKDVGGRKSGVLFVRGEPGAGKSRLLKEVADRAHAAGVIYLYAARSPASHGKTWDALVYLINRYYERYAAARDSLRRALSPPQRRALGELAPIFGSWAGKASGRKGGNGTHRAAMESALDGILGGGPVVLLLDDMQSADRMTLDLLRHLLRKDGLPLGLVGTSTDEPPRGSMVADFLTDFQSRGRLKQILLPPMSASDVGAMVAAIFPGFAVPSWLGDAVVEICRGNPRYVEEALRWLIVHGKVGLEGSAWTCRLADAAEARRGLETAVRTAEEQPAEKSFQLLTNATDRAASGIPEPAREAPVPPRPPENHPHRRAEDVPAAKVEAPPPPA
ncbi:MAG: diguanylate cyclase, partial [Planctomycetes bacterium]|nr:diguanylate cyclase [Planctomycetota bacterium]